MSNPYSDVPNHYYDWLALLNRAHKFVPSKALYDYPWAVLSLETIEPDWSIKLRRHHGQ